MIKLERFLRSEKELEDLFEEGMPHSTDEEATCDVWCKICKKTCKKPLLNHGDVHQCGHTKEEAGG